MENEKQQTVKSAVEEKKSEGNLALTKEDGYTYTDLNWIRLWPKNPKFPNEKAQKILRKSIEKFGLTGPLKITPDGEILGGNQRYRVLKELAKENKKWERVWVEVVDLWTDQERFEFALMDNYEAGEYSKEQLKPIVEKLTKQNSLFSDMELKIGNGSKLKDLVTELDLPENEFEFNYVKKVLQKQGMNQETISALEMMTSFSKVNENLPDVDLKGKIVGEKFPMIFYVEDKITFQQLEKIFDSGYKGKYNIEKLIDVTENSLQTKLPVTDDKLAEIIKEIRSVDSDIKFREETKEKYEKQLKLREDLILEFHKLTQGQSYIE